MKSALGTENRMSAAGTFPMFVQPPAAELAARWPRFRGENPAVNPVDADHQLVSDCLAGKEAAWEELVRVHTKRVFAVCYRFTGTTEEAQDLTQEVFLRVFRTLRTFRAGEGSFTV